MEYDSFGPNNYEAPEGSSDSPDSDKKKTKKKARFLELPIDNQESKDNKPAAEAKKPARTEAEAKTEAQAETLSEDETKQATQQIASEHLATMHSAESATQAELAPAEDFLERVADGQATDEAFYEAAERAHVTPAEADAALLELVQAPPVEAVHDDEPALDGVIETNNQDEGEIAWRERPVAEHTLPLASHRYYERRNNRSHDFIAGAVVGGVVGNLMGRRKERLKTEKRLAPVQKKLEQQVTALEQRLVQKEQALVLAVAKRGGAEAKPAAATTRRPEASVAVNAERMQPGRQETRLGMEKPVRAERLGHMVIAAEAPRKQAERVRMERPNSIREAFRAEEVKTMSRNEVLELSEKIVVEGANLRRIYESRLIGEKQLRHLVTEYLQGKDIRKDLRREMVEHEIDFERDPILRDRVRSHLATNNTGGGLGELLASVGIVENEADPALERRIAADEQRRAEAKRKHDRRQAMADTAMLTAIVVLATVVAVLLMRG
jgi:hypothetical protein